METHHLAQVNIAKAKAPMDDPIMKGFVEQLDHINSLADSSPGFVWRLQTEEGDATGVRAYEDERIIFNLSVWESVTSLKNYVFSGDHLTVMYNKKDWFEAPDKLISALWWIPAGTLPTVESAKAALAHLQKNGPGPEVFTFGKIYPAPRSALATE